MRRCFGPHTQAQAKPPTTGGTVTGAGVGSGGTNEKSPSPPQAGAAAAVTSTAAAGGAGGSGDQKSSPSHPLFGVPGPSDSTYTAFEYVVQTPIKTLVEKEWDQFARTVILRLGDPTKFDSEEQSEVWCTANWVHPFCSVLSELPDIRENLYVQIEVSACLYRA